MANLVLSLAQAYAAYARASLIRKTRRPLETQSQFLLRLLRVQQNTELGKIFGLSEIRSVNQFRERVPILPYASYEPYTDRIALGEPNVLNADPVIYINLTSGSTGKQKMVPVTQRFKASLNKSNAAALGFFLEAFPRYAAQHPERRLEFGKMVSTNSIRLQGQTEGGIEYGPVTAGSFRMNRSLCQQTFAQPLEAMEIADGVSRHYVCLLFSLVNPQVRGIVANFPMLMLRTCQYLDKYAEALIQDIATGSLASWLILEPNLQAKLMQQWRPYPRRAAELRSVLEAEGKLTPYNAWKQLSLIGTALGGTSDFYLKRFPDYFGDLPVFGGVYGTAEANFGVCYELNQEGCILAIESGFYEFVPPDQWEMPQPKTLLPTEVKVGEQYRILLSSYSGFYRYDIGDVVEVLGFFENTPIIVFRHRRGGLLSSTTEKTTEYHLTQTMRALQQEFGLLIDDFCVTLSEQEFPAHYLVNIELAAGQHLNNPEAFLARFDLQLGEFNDQYRLVRQDAVPPPRLRLLAPGSFTLIKRRLLQRGTSESQLKLPHLSEDRNFLASVTVEQEIWLPLDVAMRH